MTNGYHSTTRADNHAPALATEPPRHRAVRQRNSTLVSCRPPPSGAERRARDANQASPISAARRRHGEGGAEGLGPAASRAIKA